MAGKKTTPSKRDALRDFGALNPRPDKVADPLFRGHDFFDPDDLLQVKYEMLRRVRKEGRTVREAARAFGFSRVSFYRIAEAFDRQGSVGLLPDKRGPKRAHKLDGEVVDFILETLADDPSLSAPELAGLVEERFGISVHPRSVERALARRQKKRAKKR